MLYRENSSPPEIEFNNIWWYPLKPEVEFRSDFTGND